MPRLHGLKAHLLAIGFATYGACAGAAPIFNVSRPAGPGLDYTRNALLTSVDFGAGQVYNSSQFVYPSSVTGFTWGGDRDRVRIVSGSNTTGTTGFHRMEAEDGNRYNITQTDKNLFNNRIKDAFSNNNLNNFLDIIYTDNKPYSYVVNFAQPIVDNNNATDNVGEVLLFERGSPGSNSYVMLAVDSGGNTIGTPYLMDPNGPGQPTSLTPYTTVPTFDVDGNEVGFEQLEGLAIDISSAFGVTSLSSIKIYSPTVGQFGYTGGESFPDLKLFAINVPEPTSVAAIGVIAVAGLSTRRRRL